MVSVIENQADPTKSVLTATMTLYVDKLLSSILKAEVEEAIRAQAKKDLKKPEVRELIAKAATERLLAMLSEPPKSEPQVVIKEVIREVPVPSSPVVQAPEVPAAPLPASAQRIVDEAVETFAPKAAGTAKPNPADYVARATATPARRHAEGILE
jgi:hypothetical protein